MKKVIAIRNHSKGWFKVGDEFTVIGSRTSDCRCRMPLVDIGLRHAAGVFSECAACGQLAYSNHDGVRYYAEFCFAPVEPIKQAIDELLYSARCDERGAAEVVGAQQ